MSDSPIARAKAILSEANLTFTRRLTFQQKCAAYALLQCGYPKHVVAAVIEMADMTAGRLAKTSETNRIHTDVAKEYHRLGSEEFSRIYLTDEILTKAQAVVLGLESNSKTPKRNADRSEGYWRIPPEVFLPAEAFRVLWIDNEGWAISEDGANVNSHQRFASSSLARRQGYKNFGAIKQKPMRLSEREARALWAELKKTSNEVDKNLDKQNQEE
jgi:hypothetical protein